MVDYHASRRRRRRLIAVLSLLAGVVAGNVVTFESIESSARYDPLLRFPSDNIILLGHEGSRTVRDRIGPYVALAEIAPGSVVAIPQDGLQRSANARVLLSGFGHVSRIDEVPEGVVRRLLSANPEFDPEPYIVARGPGGVRGTPWAIAVADLPGDAGDPDGFLTRALAVGPERPPTGAMPARQFLLLPWPGPLRTSDGGPTVLFLDTALLDRPATAGVTGSGHTEGASGR